jgi:predicted ATPase
MHLKSVSILPEKFPIRDKYPFNIEILNNPGKLVFGSNLVFFAGENGTGKSTLLRAIAMKCGVHIWDDTSRLKYDYNPYEDRLDEALEIQWRDGRVTGSYFNAQIFESFARLLDEWADGDPGLFNYFGGGSLRTVSHGQSLMAFFRSNAGRKGIHFMDEPEAALSPETQLKLLDVLVKSAAAGQAQFIIATHSPILLSAPGALIYSFDKKKIKAVDYRDTAHYNVYRDFFRREKKPKRKRK